MWFLTRGDEAVGSSQAVGHLLLYLLHGCGGLEQLHLHQGARVVLHTLHKPLTLVEKTHQLVVDLVQLSNICVYDTSQNSCRGGGRCTLSDVQCTV